MAILNGIPPKNIIRPAMLNQAATPAIANAVNNVRVDLLYGLYRDWFGRFILPDYYDFWGQGKRRKWLLKNLVEKNNYKMTEERYNKLIVASNSPLNLIE